MYRLSKTAEEDLARIIETVSADDELGGPDAASSLFDILDAHMARIATGLVVGHPNPAYRTRRPLLFSTASPTRYVIAIEPLSLVIASIGHGARDPDSLFANA